MMLMCYQIQNYYSDKDVLSLVEPLNDSDVDSDVLSLNDSLKKQMHFSTLNHLYYLIHNDIDVLSEPDIASLIESLVDVESLVESDSDVLKLGNHS